MMATFLVVLLALASLAWGAWIVIEDARWVRGNRRLFRQYMRYQREIAAAQRACMWQTADRIIAEFYEWKKVECGGVVPRWVEGAERADR